MRLKFYPISMSLHIGMYNFILRELDFCRFMVNAPENPWKGEFPHQVIQWRSLYFARKHGVLSY